MSGDQAQQFILDHKLRLSGSHANTQKSEKFQPQRRKNIIENLFTGVEGSLPFGWSGAELNRIFSMSTREEVLKFAERCASTEKFFAGMRTELTGIAALKKATNPEVERLIELGKQQRRGAVVK